MDELAITRRNLLKGGGVGLLGLAGFSAGGMPVAAHEKIDTPATDLLGPIQVPANSDAGFNYPYYLYIPEQRQSEPVPMLVEPNNTGTPSDDLEKHRSAVEARFADGLGPQLYSKALVVPLLVPVFPRPAGDIAPAGTYTHALDEDTMELEGTEIERVDLQLLEMIEHARGLLADLSYPVADDILLNGFSASGNFVNRFAALHPDSVRSLTAGGINGTPILPLERAKGHELDYPIGVADIEELTGESFDAARWRDVAQFLYMGGEDENDTIPYDDAWSERHQRVALDVYGEDMQEDRMPYSESVYDDAGADATFKTYEGVGHTPLPLQIQQDIASFHRRNAKLKRLSFSERPKTGDRTIQFDTFIFADQEYQLRVRSAERGDITETPATVATDGEDTSEVRLSTAVANEEIVGIALPAGTTNPDAAGVSVRARVSELPLLGIEDPPTVARPSIRIEYGVSRSYQTSSAIHLYVQDSSGGRSLLTTFAPGTVDSATFDLTRDQVEVAVEEGGEIAVSLVDVDDGSTLSTASIEIGPGDGSVETSPETATVGFSTQPTDGRDSLDITYSIEDGYEPNKALTLQAGIGEDTTVLLDALTVGEDGTGTFSIEKIQMVAGADIAVNAVDEQVIATDRTVVLKDTNGAVTVGYTNPPTDDDQRATVEYSVSESYEVADSLTLRVYDGTLNGTDPGEAFALVSPGDTGQASFTTGEDIDANVEDPVVAVVDDVPLARTSMDDGVGGSESGVETTEETPDEQERSEETADEPTDGQERSEETAEVEQTNNTEQSDEVPQGAEDEQAATTTEADGPGFGVGGALGSLGGLSYVLKRRLEKTSSEQSPSDERE